MGNVQFSLSFPLPVDSYLNEKGIPVFDKFWDLPDEDTERYKGIFRMKTQAQYDQPWLPMTFYNKENARFGE